MNTTVTQASHASSAAQDSSKNAEQSSEETSFPFAAVLEGTKALFPPAEVQHSDGAADTATPPGQKVTLTKNGQASTQLAQLLAGLSGKSVTVTPTPDADSQATKAGQSTDPGEGTSSKQAHSGRTPTSEGETQATEVAVRSEAKKKAAATKSGQTRGSGAQNGTDRADGQKAPDNGRTAARTPTGKGTAHAQSPESSAGSQKTPSPTAQPADGKESSSRVTESPSPARPLNTGEGRQPKQTNPAPAAVQKKAKHGASSEAATRHVTEDKVLKHEPGEGLSAADSNKSDRRSRSGSSDQGSNRGGGRRQQHQQGKQPQVQLTRLQQQLTARPGSDGAASASTSPEQLQDVSTADTAVSDDSASSDDAKELSFSSKGQNKTASGNTSRTGEAPSAQLRRRWTQAVRARTLHTAKQNGDWKQLNMELPGRDGTMQLMAKRGEQEISVSVRFSDPGIRAALEGQVEQVRQALQAEYDSPVDFSLMDGGSDGEATFADDSENRSGDASPAVSADTRRDEDSDGSNKRRRRSLSNHEWIG